MRTLLVMTIAVLLAVPFAQATVIATHDGGNPTAGLPGYTSYIASLVSDTADDPAGYTGVPPAGMNGPMNQIMAFGALATPTMTNANLIGPPFGETWQDSHFLLLDTDLLVVTTPSETATYLGGEFAILVAARSNPLPLALVVIADVPPGQQVVLTGTAGDAGANIFPVNLVIPEPLTLTLLGVGGLALIRRRRR